MTDDHDAAVEAACRALYPAYNPKRHGEMRCDMREAIAAFLREWRPSDLTGASCSAAALQYAARATADELDPPPVLRSAEREAGWRWGSPGP